MQTCQQPTLPVEHVHTSLANTVHVTTTTGRTRVLRGTGTAQGNTASEGILVLVLVLQHCTYSRKNDGARIVPFGISSVLESPPSTAPQHYDRTPHRRQTTNNTQYGVLQVLVPALVHSTHCTVLDYVKNLWKHPEIDWGTF